MERHYWAMHDLKDWFRDGGMASDVVYIAAGAWNPRPGVSYSTGGCTYTFRRKTCVNFAETKCLAFTKLFASLCALHITIYM